MIKATIFIFLISFTLINSQTVLVDNARINFYKASKEEKYLLMAVELFEEILKNSSQNEARWKVYLGSLESMKAMYSLWPQNKLEHANKGISMMEKWIQKADSDIEALFVYGTSCYYMPFFMGQKDNADWAFNRIVDVCYKSELLEEKELMNNVLEFLEKEYDLDDSRKEKLEIIKKKYSSN